MHPHEHGDHTDHPAASDPKDFHGMVLWGTDSIYLSHLPMVGHPLHPTHAYQVIFEADLVGPDGSPVAEFAADRRKHPDQKLYSLAPEEFVLPDILPESGAPPRVSAISGDLFRNRFDQEGVGIAGGVVAKIKNVIHFRKFDPKAPKLKNLEYIVFGKPGEIYLAHLVTRPPDFDHIMQVRVDHELSGESLGRGLALTIPDRSNDRPQRLKEGEGVSATLHGADGGEKAVKVEPVAEVYYCEDAPDFG